MPINLRALNCNELQYRLKHLIFNSTFLVFTLLSQAQTGIDTLLLNYRKMDTREKAYVHFDRSLYNPGETIWFKAYLSSGSSRSELSTTLYAEIRSDSGALLEKKTAPVLFSGASSHFEIPATYSRQRMVFRAYTVGMLNGDTTLLYSKAIAIANPKPRTQVSTGPYLPAMAFLPEGGNMVEGLSGNVAFRYAYPDGKPVNISGIIVGADGAKVTDFQSVHDGMGVFSFSPQPGKGYYAIWKDSAGKENKQALPAPVQEGVSLHVSDKLDDITGLSVGKTFTVSRSANVPESQKRLNLVGTMNGYLVYEARLNLTARTSVSAVLPTDDLESGILQVTVFDANMFPLAERICFVNNHAFEFDADAWMTELNPTKRALNAAEVKISDTIAVNMSLSITDADLDQPEWMEDNILTNTLFTGDLRGKVHRPYYYLYSTSDSVPYHIDLVMLTHGWRRYNWEKILNEDTSRPSYVENYFLSIEGKLLGGSSKFKHGLELVGFMKTGKTGRSNLVMLPLDRLGNFRQEGLFFYDTASLYLSYNDKNRVFDPGDVMISNGLLQSNSLPGTANAMTSIPFLPNADLLQKNLANNKEYLKVKAKQFANAHELEGVTVTARAKSNIEKMDERYTSGLFSGGHSTQFDIANDPTAGSSLSVFQYLQGRVAGLQITGAGPNATLSWRGGAPGLYLDEMESDASMVGSINMSDVAYIKVFNPGSSFGFRNGGNGVIAVYTKRGDDVSSSSTSQVGRIVLNGYSAIKEFYAYDYSKPSPDDYYENLGATLYWDPNIWLGENQKRKVIRFYNNDITKRFRLVLEGVDADGRLLHVEKVVSKD